MFSIKTFYIFIAALTTTLDEQNNLPPSKKLEDDCYQELCDHVEELAASLGSTTESLMSNMPLRTMSEQMPQTEEDMLQIIVDMAKANYKKYGGKGLLEITKRYSREKEGEEFCTLYLLFLLFVT